MQGQEFEIYKIMGVISGVGIFFGIFVYKYIIFATGKIYSFLEDEMKELKSIVKDNDMVHTKMVDNIYSKIDEINIVCRERGQQIGEIKGRINGKD